MSFLFFLLMSSAQTPQDLFAAGVRAELEGDASNAESAWEKITQTGVHNADVEFNLGTSYGQRGEFGPSILHLRRAALLRPQADATANLQLVRERLLQQNPGKTAESSLLADISALLLRVPIELVLGVALLLASLFAFAVYGPWPKHALSPLFWASASVAAVASILLCVRVSSLDGKPAAVVMKRTPAKNGPDERFKTLTELVPGEELWLVPAREASLGFVAVQLSNGDAAFVAEGSVVKVKDW